MKTQTVLLIIACLCCTLWAGSDAAPDGAVAPAGQEESALTTDTDAITIPRLLSYQGKLTDTMGIPVPNGNYSTRFRLYTVPSGGTQYWQETQNVSTEDGLFAVLLGSVTPIPYVPEPGNLYLGMKVGADAEMMPRVRIASTAYAYLCRKADTADYVASARPSGSAGGDLSGTYPDPTIDNGAVTTPKLYNLAVTDAKLANGAVTAGKLSQMGAGHGQVLKWTGSTWAPRNDSVGGGGGGGTVTSVSQSTGITCTPNPITATGTVALNTGYADGRYVNVTGDSMSGLLRIGNQLRVHDKAALGYSCYNSGTAAFCAGTGNNAGGDYASIAGGEDNSADGRYSHVSGGSENQADGLWAIVGGGNVNEANDTATTVGGGRENFAASAYAAVAGGYSNDASGRYSAICGGFDNKADSGYATVGGGYRNSAASSYSTACGGSGNTASTYYATVCGGAVNTAGEVAFVGGGIGNDATGHLATIAGGDNNTADSSWGAIGGGRYNEATARYAAIAGGRENEVDSIYGAVGGGRDNIVRGYAATICGGNANRVQGGESSTIGGGQGNYVSGHYATVPGGSRNYAHGFASLAAGTVARANHGGCFVWSDSTYYNSDSVYSTGANQFRDRARGGTWFYSNFTRTTGAYLAPGSNSWASACDSANKEDFREVDRDALLEKVSGLRVRDYKMKDQGDDTRHIGPVAQDFHAAFGVGENNTSINLADADGVLFAAVQALCEQNRILNERVAVLEAELHDE